MRPCIISSPPPIDAQNIPLLFPVFCGFFEIFEIIPLLVYRIYSYVVHSCTMDNKLIIIIIFSCVSVGRGGREPCPWPWAMKIIRDIIYRLGRSRQRNNIIPIIIRHTQNNRAFLLLRPIIFQCKVENLKKSKDSGFPTRPPACQNLSIFLNVQFLNFALQDYWQHYADNCYLLGFLFITDYNMIIQLLILCFK